MGLLTSTASSEIVLWAGSLSLVKTENYCFSTLRNSAGHMVKNYSLFSALLTLTKMYCEDEASFDEWLSVKNANCIKEVQQATGLSLPPFFVLNCVNMKTVNDW